MLNMLNDYQRNALADAYRSSNAALRELRKVQDRLSLSDVDLVGLENCIANTLDALDRID